MEESYYSWTSLAKEQSRTFQFVDNVRDFSSHYGSDAGVSYTAYNIVGSPSIFPKLCDDTKAFLMRTYGSWWQNIPSADFVKLTTVLPRSCSVLSEDFIEVQFRVPVYPCELHLYETYNPSALVRILCFCYETKKWKILWHGKPKVIKVQKGTSFTPTMKRLNWADFKTELEFYHQHLDYYYELDAVELCGYKEPPSDDESAELDSRRNSSSLNNPVGVESKKFKVTCSDDEVISNFEKMPIEVLHLIFSYLDLESLCSAAQVSRLFKSLCYDPMLFSMLNLQPLWHKVTSSTLEGLRGRCSSLQKLSLSWCGDHQRITTYHFIEFVQDTCQFLTCLVLSNCHFVENYALKAIAKTCTSLQVLDIKSCDNKKLNMAGFCQISQLKNLVYLNVSRTAIDQTSLCHIIKSCPHLEHLFMGDCRSIVNFYEVVKEVGTHLKNIKTLELFRAKSVNAEAVRILAENCQNLVELDLGWCREIDVSSGSLQCLFKNCTKLKKLFLTAMRNLSDTELIMMSIYCKELEQLDILGAYNVTLTGIERVLKSCKKLKLFDVSFCYHVERDACNALCPYFPNVQIKQASSCLI